MHLAVWKGKMDAARCLVEECKADIGIKKNVRVHEGAGTPSGARLTCPSVAAVSTQDGATPLHLAASGGQIAAAAWLVSLGCDVNVRSKNGDSPLHLACWRGHLDCAKWLVEHGATPTCEKNVRLTDSAGLEPC